MWDDVKYEYHKAYLKRSIDSGLWELGWSYFLIPPNGERRFGYKLYHQVVNIVIYCLTIPDQSLNRLC